MARFRPSLSFFGSPGEEKAFLLLAGLSPESYSEAKGRQSIGNRRFGDLRAIQPERRTRWREEKDEYGLAHTRLPLDTRKGLILSGSFLRVTGKCLHL